MARHRREQQPLPPPLPPETRTVGQLVAETLKLYGQHLWPSFAIGLGLALVNQVNAGREPIEQAFLLAIAAPVVTASYVAASALVLGVRPPASVVARAIAVGSVIWIPAAFLSLLFALPALAWLAFVGLTVPVIVAERLPTLEALKRATQLARADFIHVFGGLATLAILFTLVKLSLILVLRGQGEQTDRLALLLGDVVMAPLLFLGGALLYVDQAARVRSRSHPEEA
jgi:hypothetical protein